MPAPTDDADEETGEDSVEAGVGEEEEGPAGGDGGEDGVANEDGDSAANSSEKRPAEQPKT